MGLKLHCINYSQNSLSTELWSPRRNMMVFIIYMLIAIPWNLAVIVTVLRKCLFLQPAIMLFLSLAIADFLLCLALPFNVFPAISYGCNLGDTD